jgi:hypothetical protein
MNAAGVAIGQRSKYLVRYRQGRVMKVGDQSMTLAAREHGH